MVAALLFGLVVGLFSGVMVYISLRLMCPGYTIPFFGPAVISFVLLVIYFTVIGMEHEVLRAGVMTVVSQGTAVLLQKLQRLRVKKRARVELSTQYLRNREHDSSLL